ncbi:MAG: hypothetical protein PHY29_02885 [Syntrophales bacterium]|nr:hypothetical protein [Syntrophales bacterium]
MIDSERTERKAKERILLKTPQATGPICTCPRCKMAFRAQSRKSADALAVCKKALGMDTEISPYQYDREIARLKGHKS